jgi:hypothetical protein
MMGNIDWIAIADLPEDLKDGRDVLLWVPDILDWPDRPGAVSVYWDTDMGWCSNSLGGFTPRGNPTHFAEINPPQ